MLYAIVFCLGLVIGAVWILKYHTHVVYLQLQLGQQLSTLIQTFSGSMTPTSNVHIVSHGNCQVAHIDLIMPNGSRGVLQVPTFQLPSDRGVRVMLKKPHCQHQEVASPCVEVRDAKGTVSRHQLGVGMRPCDFDGHEFIIQTFAYPDDGGAPLGECCVSDGDHLDFARALAMSHNPEAHPQEFYD